MKIWWIALLLCLAISVGSAQKNEFAAMASSFQTSASFNVHGGQGLQLNYAHRIVDIKLAGLAQRHGAIAHQRCCGRSALAAGSSRHRGRSRCLSAVVDLATDFRSRRFG